MPEVSFEIKGLKQLAANRSKLSKSLERSILRTGLNNAAKPVVAMARDKVRGQGLIRTGELAAEGIAAGPGSSSPAKILRNGFGFVQIGYRRENFYGGFHELGTSQVPAKPHLRPAIEEAFQSKAITGAMVDSFNKSVARQLKKVT